MITEEDYEQLKGENEQLQEQISTLQGQFIDQDIKIKDAYEDIYRLKDDYQDICELSARLFLGMDREWIMQQLEGDYERFKNHIGI